MMKLFISKDDQPDMNGQWVTLPLSEPLEDETYHIMDYELPFEINDQVRISWLNDIANDLEYLGARAFVNQFSPYDGEYIQSVNELKAIHPDQTVSFTDDQKWFTYDDGKIKPLNYKEYQETLNTYMQHAIENYR
ncbi:hypothetical protein [Aerococcus tenax]